MTRSSPIKVITAKTVRFTQVVAQCGTPEWLTLWVAPEKDPTLKKAFDEKRIMTLKQSAPGAGADFALIGYVPGPHASFVLFPKSLSRFEGLRVIGIKYDLIKTSVSGPKAEPGDNKPRGTLRRAATPETPALKEFAVTYRCTAELNISHTITARNKSEARREALKRAASCQPDFSAAKPVCRIVRIREKS